MKIETVLLEFEVTRDFQFVGSTLCSRGCRVLSYNLVAAGVEALEIENLPFLIANADAAACDVRQVLPYSGRFHPTVLVFVVARVTDAHCFSGVMHLRASDYRERPKSVAVAWADDTHIRQAETALFAAADGNRAVISSGGRYDVGDSW